MTKNYSNKKLNNPITHWTANENKTIKQLYPTTTIHCWHWLQYHGHYNNIFHSIFRYKTIPYHFNSLLTSTAIPWHINIFHSIFRYIYAQDMVPFFTSRARDHITIFGHSTHIEHSHSVHHLDRLFDTSTSLFLDRKHSEHFLFNAFVQVPPHSRLIKLLPLWCNSSSKTCSKR